MIRRTTVDLDEDLVARAKRALGATTTRGAIEEALRRAAVAAESDRAVRAKGQLAYLAAFGRHADMDVLASDEMWR